MYVQRKLTILCSCVGKETPEMNHVWSQSVCTSTSCNISCADRTLVLRPGFGLNAIISDFISAGRRSSLDLLHMWTQSQSRLWCWYLCRVQGSIVTSVSKLCEIALWPEECYVKTLHLQPYFSQFDFSKRLLVATLPIFCLNIMILLLCIDNKSWDG